MSKSPAPNRSAHSSFPEARRRLVGQLTGISGMGETEDHAPSAGDLSAVLADARMEYAATLEGVYRNFPGTPQAEQAFTQLRDLLAAAGPVDQTDLTKFVPPAWLEPDTLLDIALFSPESETAGWNAVSSLRTLYGNDPILQDTLQRAFAEMVASSPSKKVRWWAMNAVAFSCERYEWIAHNTLFPGDYPAGEYARQQEGGRCP